MFSFSFLFSPHVHLNWVPLLSLFACWFQPGLISYGSVFLSQQTSTSRAYQPRNQLVNRLSVFLLFISPYHSLLVSFHLHGLSMGESPPRIDIVMHRCPPKWCTQEILEECYWRWSNDEDWRRHEVHRAIRYGAHLEKGHVQTRQIHRCHLVISNRYSS